MRVLKGQEKKLYVYGNNWPTKDGTCVRDFIHVNDVVDAIVLLMSEDIRTLKPAYDIGTGIGNIVEDLGILAGWQGIEVTDGDPCEAQDNTADNTDLVRLGWTPKINVEDYILRHAVPH